ncbi:BRISC complex subunit Abraxas 2-like isoform X2 [Lethenteron reissneri]|uniref:BRISC complex subunit Abraxas 2-like isoform X2 n=1 Tax=Lethenteron reissneri TaxID=7753 RepID=UPI002AB5E21B|nr:BRISC complex subunit Abraxas 2-like isoform X2 [Lethenteron reissneri]
MARLSGWTLGQLQLAQLSSASDHEGFLLGDVREDEVRSISDSNISNVESKQVLSIYSHIPCTRLASFYNSVAIINEDTLGNIIKSKEKEVIGFYKFRWESDQKISFREQLLLQRLRDTLQVPDLVFLLFTMASSSNRATYTMEYTLFKPNGRFYERIPMTISNLGQSGLESYWDIPPPCHSTTCRNLLSRSKFVTNNGEMRDVNNILQLNTELQNKLEHACSDVLDGERSVEVLFAEISSLKQAIEEKKKDALLKSTNLQGENSFRVNHDLEAALMREFPNSVEIRSTRVNMNCTVVLSDINADVQQRGRLRGSRTSPNSPKPVKRDHKTNHIPTSSKSELVKKSEVSLSKSVKLKRSIASNSSSHVFPTVATSQFNQGSSLNPKATNVKNVKFTPSKLSSKQTGVKVSMGLSLSEKKILEETEELKTELSNDHIECINITSSSEAEELRKNDKTEQLPSTSHVGTRLSTRSCSKNAQSSRGATQRENVATETLTIASVSLGDRRPSQSVATAKFGPTKRCRSKTQNQKIDSMQVTRGKTAVKSMKYEKISSGQNHVNIEIETLNDSLNACVSSNSPTF